MIGEQLASLLKTIKPAVINQASLSPASHPPALYTLEFIYFVLVLLSVLAQAYFKFTLFNTCIHSLIFADMLTKTCYTSHGAISAVYLNKSLSRVNPRVASCHCFLRAESRRHIAEALFKT